MSFSKTLGRSLLTPLGDLREPTIRNLYNRRGVKQKAKAQVSLGGQRGLPGGGGFTTKHTQDKQTFSGRVRTGSWDQGQSEHRPEGGTAGCFPGVAVSMWSEVKVAEQTRQQGWGRAETEGFCRLCRGV